MLKVVYNWCVYICVVVVFFVVCMIGYDLVFIGGIFVFLFFEEEFDFVLYSEFGCVLLKVNIVLVY